MSKETTEIKTPVSVALYESENAMVEDGGAVIGDFVTTGLANCAAHAINNHDRLVEENKRLREFCESLQLDVSNEIKLEQLLSEMDGEYE